MVLLQGAGSGVQVVLLPSPLGGEGLGARGLAASTPSPPTPLPQGERGEEEVMPTSTAFASAIRRTAGRRRRPARTTSQFAAAPTAAPRSRPPGRSPAPPAG